MARDIAIDKMVSLPRLNAESATALAEQLLTAANEETGSGLPAALERQRARLQAANGSLLETLLPKDAPSSKACMEADFVEDDAWRALSQWVFAMSSMPEGAFSELEQIRALNRLLFDEGLSFLKLPYREEWAAARSRLEALAEGGYEPIIEKLGGGPILANLKTAQQKYGEALGIKAKMTVKETPVVRERLLSLISVMKAYVVKVMAHADPDEPGSEALSTALLTPLLQWKDTKRPPRPRETEAENNEDNASDL